MINSSKGARTQKFIFRGQGAGGVKYYVMVTMGMIMTVFYSNVPVYKITLTLTVRTTLVWFMVHLSTIL